MTVTFVRTHGGFTSGTRPSGVTLADPLVVTFTVIATLQRAGGDVAFLPRPAAGAETLSVLAHPVVAGTLVEVRACGLVARRAVPPLRAFTFFVCSALTVSPAVVGALGLATVGPSETFLTLATTFLTHPVGGALIRTDRYFTRSPRVQPHLTEAHSVHTLPPLVAVGRTRLHLAEVSTVSSLTFTNILSRAVTVSIAIVLTHSLTAVNSSKALVAHAAATGAYSVAVTFINTRGDLT